MSLGDPRVRPVLLLSALVTLLTLESLRATAPLLVDVARAGGSAAAVVVTLIVFAVPAAAGPLTRWLGPSRATAAAVVLLVLLRLIVQLQPTPGFLLTTLTTATALTALLLTTHLATTLPPTPSPTPTPASAAAGVGGPVAAAGILLGTALDAAARTALATWDPLWRPGLLPWLYALPVAAVTLLTLTRTTRSTVSASAWSVVRLGALGAFLGVDLLVTGSPAVLAARAGVGLPFAGAALLVGALLAIEAVSRLRLPGGSGRLPDLAGRRAGIPAAVVLVAAVAVSLYLTGPLTVVTILLAQVAAAILLARTLQSTQPTRSAVQARVARSVGAGGMAGSVEFALAGLGTGLVLAVVVLAYQGLVATGLDGRWALVAGAVPLALAGLGRRPGDVPAEAAGGARDASGAGDAGRRRRGWLAVVAGVPAVLLVVPVVVLVMSPAAGEQGGAADAVRVVSWDVGQGVGDGGAVDAGRVAEVVKRQRADVVLLQDVGRGAVGSGGVDLAEYLSRALAMGYVWAPAGDGRTGTVVLARLPMSRVRTGTLVDGGRGGAAYASVSVELRSGQRLTVVSAALPAAGDEAAGDRTSGDGRTGDGASGDGVRERGMRELLTVWGGRRGVGGGDGGWWRGGGGGGWGGGGGGPGGGGGGGVEVAAARDAGLVSAQDSAGHSGLGTVPAGRPSRRVDWVFGTPDVSFSGFALPAAGVSDHLPLAVTVRLG